MRISITIYHLSMIENLEFIKKYGMEGTPAGER